MKTLAQLRAQIEAGIPATYDDVADLFAQTIMGKATMDHNRLDREALIAVMRKRYPMEADLGRAVAQLAALVDPSMWDEPTRH